MTWVAAVVELPWDQGAEFIVLPRSIAEKQARWVKVFSCGTWGDVREVATAAEYNELLERAGFGTYDGFSEHLSVGRPLPGVEALTRAAFTEHGGDLPADDDEFLPIDQIPAHADGDFPPDVHFLMNEYLPSDIVLEHGESYETSINGEFARFEPEAKARVLEEMRKRGLEVEEDPALVAEAVEPVYT